MPEIELHGNPPDSMSILALMLFPNDEDLRHQYYAVRFAKSETEEAADSIEMDTDVIGMILEPAVKSGLLDIVSKRTKEAYIAGNVLATVYVMESFPEHFVEPSERKAIFVARKFAERSQYGDGSAIHGSESKIRQCIKDFRSVAHFWAALTLHEGFPIRERQEILASADAVRDFLGIAGTLQDFGCKFAAERPRDRDKKPILDLATIWRVPKSTKRLTPPWTAPPPWVVETLNRYKVNE